MAEDGVVDFGDESLPSVTWDGVDYAGGKWEKEWDTEWNVPVVRGRLGGERREGADGVVPRRFNTTRRSGPISSSPRQVSPPTPPPLRTSPTTSSIFARL